MDAAACRGVDGHCGGTESRRCSFGSSLLRTSPGLTVRSSSCNMAGDVVIPSKATHQRTMLGTWMVRFGPGCHATIAIFFWMVW